MDAVCFDMDGVLVDSEDYWVPYERTELLPEIGLEDLDISATPTASRWTGGSSWAGTRRRPSGSTAMT